MEHRRMERNDQVYSEVDQQWSLKGADILTTDSDERYRDTSYGFIRRLRNAVAHAHTKFSEDDMEFWDCWDGKEAYRARLARTEI